MPAGVETVVITALAEEAEAVVRALGSCAVRRWHGVDLHVGSVRGGDVLVVPVGAMGNASSAQAAQQAIAVWSPANLLITGITGGARDAADDLRLGDVLIPDQVVGYELAKLEPAGPAVRYEGYRPSHRLLEIAKSVRPEEWAMRIAAPRPDGQTGRTVPRSHIGPIFSGEKVVADTNTMRRLRADWPMALGVEMEGLGVAVASYRNGPGFLLVKGISDFADPTKENSWRAYAAEAAARFAVAVLARGHEQVPGERPRVVPVGGAARFSGTAKVQFCRRLDNWAELADYFEVPPHLAASFEHGNGPRRLWEYLEVRGQLFALPEALDACGRPDLAELLRTETT